MTTEALVPAAGDPAIAPSGAGEIVLPQVIVDAGPSAVARFLEFFAGRIANARTRAAYGRAVGQFLGWCEARGLGLRDISPLHVAAYIRTHPGSAPTVKQHLAAIRMLGDWLVVNQVLPVNPAAAVRGPKHVVTKGSTPVLSSAEARKLLDSIDTSALAGLRDRALLSVMLYSFARVSAVLGMRRQDYFGQGSRGWLRLHEKGGKRHDVPAHHRAAQPLDEYVEAAELEEPKTALFQSVDPAGRRLTGRVLQRRVVLAMISLDVSPDGETIVFDLLGDLFVVSIAGGDATQLTSGMAFDAQPRFSPDGSRIVYTSDADGGQNVWVMGSDGSDPVQISKGASNRAESPEWMPDGNYVVAAMGAFRHDIPQLKLFHEDGGSGIELISEPDYLKTIGPAVSPDGRYIWYARRDGDWAINAQLPQYQLEAYDVETGERYPRSSRYGSAMRPTLSPDGRWLVFGTRHDEHTGLVLRDLETGAERWLAYPVQHDDQESRATLDVLPGMSFTPDSRHAARVNPPEVRPAHKSARLAVRRGPCSSLTIASRADIVGRIRPHGAVGGRLRARTVGNPPCSSGPRAACRGPRRAR